MLSEGSCDDPLGVIVDDVVFGNVEKVGTLLWRCQLLPDEPPELGMIVSKIGIGNSMFQPDETHVRHLEQVRLTHCVLIPAVTFRGGFILDHGLRTPVILGN